MQNRRSCKNRYLRSCFLFLWTFVNLFAFVLTHQNASAQTDEITWHNPLNISNSPDDLSADPFLLADPAGIVHLFWAEKAGFGPGRSTDTIMYAQWESDKWSKPIDIFFSPVSDGNQVASYPHAVLDEKGNIHLIWFSLPDSPNYALNYSSVPSNEAHNASAWKPRTILADDLTGSFYGIHIAYQPPQTLHVVYARGAQGDNPEKERTVAYIRSTDGGETWSDPVDLHIMRDLKRGASNTRLLFEPPNKVYVSWSEWDESGNGQAILFARSLDSGESWENAIKLTERAEGEYERDWNNLVLLGENKLMALWEGGFRAYPQAMYSDDGGATWSEPVDTFPWLIGENGFAEFTEDSLGNVHLFICQRIREGEEMERGEGGGLYHSVWEGDRKWRDPTLSGGINPMVNPKVVILNGNRVIATWWSFTHLEIIVMAGEIGNAPPLSPVMWPTPSPVYMPTQTPESLPVNISNEIQTGQESTLSSADDSSSMTSQTSPMSSVLIGVLPAFLVVIIFIVLKVRRSQRF